MQLIVLQSPGATLRTGNVASVSGGSLYGADAVGVLTNVSIAASVAQLSGAAVAWAGASANVEGLQVDSGAPADVSVLLFADVTWGADSYLRCPPGVRWSHTRPIFGSPSHCTDVPTAAACCCHPADLRTRTYL